MLSPLISRWELITATLCLVLQSQTLPSWIPVSQHPHHASCTVNSKPQAVPGSCSRALLPAMPIPGGIERLSSAQQLLPRAGRGPYLRIPARSGSGSGPCGWGRCRGCGRAGTRTRRCRSRSWSPGSRAHRSSCTRPRCPCRWPRSCRAPTRTRRCRPRRWPRWSRAGRSSGSRPQPPHTCRCSGRAGWSTRSFLPGSLLHPAGIYRCIHLGCLHIRIQGLCKGCSHTHQHCHSQHLQSQACTHSDIPGALESRCTSCGQDTYVQCKHHRGVHNLCPCRLQAPQDRCTGNPLPNPYSFPHSHMGMRNSHCHFQNMKFLMR